ncbi:mannitol dehydrogenase family protein [Cellulomonas alba]|uniref:Mannitol-1-phosphate 5-dehydrogenase n=1 Tax=Cellulomonas alba TaxID=3053467 RepID=A0ABT7SEQ4_9CELL|nr:mannitol dehydrogenase family protein [Cellulomonas alba]MDM7854661.1 mannitol dehydrogenase family protein [Cellulomonas alba]
MSAPPDARRREPARLSAARLGAIRAGVGAPPFDPRALRTGVVHLGIGAFHRAHQAVLTQDAMAASGDDRWGVLGVTQRSRGVVDQLVPQDGLYGLLTKGARASSLRVVGVHTGVAYPGDETGRVVASIAAPATHVVTLTVTEKGYRIAPDGGLDVSDPDVAADLAALDAGARTATGLPSTTPTRPTPRLVPGPDGPPARTAVGLLLRGLAARRRADAGPLTVVSCDNLAGNGPVLAALVAQALEHARDDDLRAWVDTSVRFPATMVDRIVPATTPAHHTEAEALLGLRDAGLVVAEPFTQWVVEDAFAGPRPPWELAGATLVADVAPFERAKLRILNAVHSTLAYRGALRGLPTIADAVADPDLLAAARALVDEDVLPTLDPPPGVDLRAYRDQVLDRMANPATGHTTRQVASDGSAKLPQRLLGTVRDRLAAGAVPHAAAATLAAWIAYVRTVACDGLVLDGRAVTLDDPRADALAAAAAGPVDGLADRFLALTDVVGDLGESHELRDAVGAALRDLGVR